MGWQERERAINDALSVLKKAQEKVGKTGLRSHSETMENRAVEIVILKIGVCRECQGLILNVARRRGRRRGVFLDCKFGENPVKLHLDCLYQPGLTPICPSFKPLEQEEESLTA